MPAAGAERLKVDDQSVSQERCRESLFECKITRVKGDCISSRCRGGRQLHDEKEFAVRSDLSRREVGMRDLEYLILELIYRMRRRIKSMKNYRSGPDEDRVRLPVCPG